jgi:hypothetical protein
LADRSAQRQRRQAEEQRYQQHRVSNAVDDAIAGIPFVSGAARDQFAKLARESMRLATDDSVIASDGSTPLRAKRP